RKLLPWLGPHITCTLNSCARPDNRFIMAALYLSETTPLSLHFGEPFGSPFFFTPGSRECRSFSRGLRSAGRLRRRPPTRLFAQQLVQHANTFVHMLLLQQEWRQKPHDGVLRAVEQNAFGKAGVHDRAGGNLQLNPLDEPAPAHA